MIFHIKLSFLSRDWIYFVDLSSLYKRRNFLHLCLEDNHTTINNNFKVFKRKLLCQNKRCTKHVRNKRHTKLGIKNDDQSTPPKKDA